LVFQFGVKQTNKQTNTQTKASKQTNKNKKANKQTNKSNLPTPQPISSNLAQDSLSLTVTLKSKTSLVLETYNLDARKANPEMAI
jgi:hypothetical protein